MNSVNLVGNLTRDPAFFSQEGDKFVAKFDIATEVGYDSEKKENIVEYVPVTAFSLSATFKDYLKKGRKVSVQGRVSSESYEKDGQKIYTTSVKVTNGSLRLLDYPKKEA